MKIAFRNIPMSAVYSKSFAGVGINLDQTSVFEACLLKPEGLPPSSGTNFY